MKLSVYPNPRSITYGRGAVDLSGSRTILIGQPCSSRLKRAVLRFADNLSRVLGTKVPVCAGKPSAGQVLVEVRPGAIRGRNGSYRLTLLESGYVLDGADESGCFYGLESLRQILEQTTIESVPRSCITDSPDFTDRGFMLDISRCKVPTFAMLKEYADLLARLKINQFQLYTEHTFAFAAHSTVWRNSSPVTAQEILELDAYCRDRYIELVPNLNSFGHFERWLRHDDYRSLAECPDGFVSPRGVVSKWGSTLRPNKQSLQFLDSLYQEFLPNFSSSRFNVGCDETWELGKGWSKSRCERSSVHRVYLDFVLKINQLAHRHGRKMMFWGDIILHEPARIKDLPQECVALDWGYEHDHDFDGQCGHFAQAKIPFYVCPGTSSWNTLIGRSANCFGNLENAAVNGIKHGAAGFLNTDWGDGGHHQYFPISLPGIFAGAALSWCCRSNRGTDPSRAISAFVWGDRKSIAGSALVELGNSYRLLPARTQNRTLFDTLLFWQRTDPKILGTTRLNDLHACHERIDELTAGISRIRGNRSWQLAKAEIANNAAMAQLGLERGMVTLGEHRNATRMRASLKRIIQNHRELWLSRNRSGGLSESLGRLKLVKRWI